MKHGKHTSYGFITLIAVLAALMALFSGSRCLAAPDIELINMSGGCFQMGDTFGDGRHDEKPVHEVCVSDFCIGKYEVT